MHIIEWSSDFALGIDEIDAQHRELVGMINALDASGHGDDPQETTRRLLTQLGIYVRDHFALEERLMAGGGCTPELVSRHCGEHAYFRSVLKDLTSDFESGRRRNITATLIEYLVHWLLHHIVVVDRAMAQQLNASGPEITERVAAAMMQDITDDLTDAERHLLAELRRANEAFEQQVRERTSELSEANRKLEADVRDMSSIIAGLRDVQSGMLEISEALEPAGRPVVEGAALVLVANGAHDPDLSSSMYGLCTALRARTFGLRIELVFAESLTAELRSSAEALLAEGFGHVVVLPIIISRSECFRRDVQLLLEKLRAENPKASFELAPALGESEKILQAMASHAMALSSAS